MTSLKSLPGELPANPELVIHRLQNAARARARVRQARIARQARQKALANCPPPGKKQEQKPAPVNVDDLLKRVADDKARFEELQRQLRGEVDARFNTVDSFAKDYDRLWNDAMAPLDEFFINARSLKEPLEELWRAHDDMANALHTARKADFALALATVLWGATKAGVKTAEGAAERAAARSAERGAVKAGEAGLEKAAGAEAKAVEGKLASEAAAVGKGAESTGSRGVLGTSDAGAVWSPREGTVVFGPAVDDALAIGSYTKQVPGVFDAVLHGNPSGATASIEQISDGLVKAGWKPGQPVRMVSCEAGANGSAEALANYLTSKYGVTTSVRGPVEKLGGLPSGAIEPGYNVVSGYAKDGTPIKTWNPDKTATWIEYTPGKVPEVYGSTHGGIWTGSGYR